MKVAPYGSQKTIKPTYREYLRSINCLILLIVILFVICYIVMLVVGMGGFLVYYVLSSKEMIEDQYGHIIEKNVDGILDHFEQSTTAITQAADSFGGGILSKSVEGINMVDNTQSFTRILTLMAKQNNYLATRLCWPNDEAISVSYNPLTNLTIIMSNGANGTTFYKNANSMNVYNETGPWTIVPYWIKTRDWYNVSKVTNQDYWTVYFSGDDTKAISFSKVNKYDNGTMKSIANVCSQVSFTDTFLKTIVEPGINILLFEETGELVSTTLPNVQSAVLLSKVGTKLTYGKVNAKNQTNTFVSRVYAGFLGGNDYIDGYYVRYVRNSRMKSLITATIIDPTLIFQNIITTVIVFICAVVVVSLILFIGMVLVLVLLLKTSFKNSHAMLAALGDNKLNKFRELQEKPVPIELFKFKMAMLSLWRIMTHMIEYVPKTVVDSIISNDKITPSSFEASVIFIDIEGFTTKVKGMPPKDMFDFLNNSFFEPVMNLLERYGTFQLDKYIGDCIMGWFTNKEECTSALKELLRLKNVPRTRAGVSRGLIIAGLIGQQKKSFTIISETVNFAARLEKENKEYGLHIFVNEEQSNTQDYVYVTTTSLRGIEGKQNVYTILTEEERDSWSSPISLIYPDNKNPDPSLYKGNKWYQQFCLDRGGDSLA